jgi:hypothetical protein
MPDPAHCTDGQALILDPWPLIPFIILDKYIYWLKVAID